jgi:hypothetical protein
MGGKAVNSIESWPLMEVRMKVLSRENRLLSADGYHYGYIGKRMYCTVDRQSRWFAYRPRPFSRDCICFQGKVLIVTALRKLMDNFSIPMSASPDSGSRFAPRSAEVLEEMYAGDGVEAVAFDFGSRVRRIKTRAFSRCWKLRSICIPATVESLQEDAFEGCTGLTAVIFEPHSSLVSIGQCAFRECPSLTIICIPPSVHFVGPCAFSHEVFSSLTIDPGNRHFSIRGDYFCDFAGTTALHYRGDDRDLILPNWIRSVDHHCYPKPFPLRSLRFEPVAHLVRLEDFGFAKLRALRIPASVEVICTRCFTESRSLEMILFESGSRLSRIEDSAFEGCHSLQRLAVLRIPVEESTGDMMSLTSRRLTHRNACANYHLFSNLLAHRHLLIVLP